jgi:hypothetical protein
LLIDALAMIEVARPDAAKAMLQQALVLDRTRPICSII